MVAAPAQQAELRVELRGRDAEARQVRRPILGDTMIHQDRHFVGGLAAPSSPRRASAPPQTTCRAAVVRQWRHGRGRYRLGGAWCIRIISSEADYAIEIRLDGLFRDKSRCRREDARDGGGTERMIPVESRAAQIVGQNESVRRQHVTTHRQRVADLLGDRAQYRLVRKIVQDLRADDEVETGGQRVGLQVQPLEGNVRDTLALVRGAREGTVRDVGGEQFADAGCKQAREMALGASELQGAANRRGGEQAEGAVVFLGLIVRAVVPGIGSLEQRFPIAASIVGIPGERPAMFLVIAARRCDRARRMCRLLLGTAMNGCKRLAVAGRPWGRSGAIRQRPGQCRRRQRAQPARGPPHARRHHTSRDGAQHQGRCRDGGAAPHRRPSHRT